MNAWLIAILLILVVSYILDLLVSILNLKALNPELPNEFVDIYDSKEYARSQKYTRVTTGFSLIERTTSFIIILIFCSPAALIFLMSSHGAMDYPHY